MKNNRSSLLLMEIIIAVLMFSLCSAVCLRLFVHSRELSCEARDLNSAVAAVSTIEEVYMTSESTDKAIEILSNVYDNCVTTDNGGAVTLENGSKNPVVVTYEETDSKDGLISLDITATTETPSGHSKTIYETKLEVFYEK